MEIIILTTLISTLFLIFIFGPMAYAHELEKKRDVSVNEFIRALIKGGEGKKKRDLTRAISRTISDMESGGVYFSDEVKEELRKSKEEDICEYSGLPSVRTYNRKYEKS